MFIEIGNAVRALSKSNRAVLPVAVASLMTISAGVNASTIGRVFDDLSNGSQVSGVLLNHGKSTEKYFKVGKNDPAMDRQYEWGQSVALYYRSGRTRIGDTPVKVNFNLGYSYMFKLASDYPGDIHAWNYGEKIFMSEDCELVGTQYKCNDSTGYGKIPVANVKFDWGKSRTNRGMATIGDGFFNVGMITAATDDDALLSSYRGIMAQHTYGEYTVDGAYVIGFMSGNEDEMGDLSGGSNYYDPNPIKYDSLYTLRVRKKFGSTAGYQVAYGEAKDYLRRFHGAAYYNLKLDPQTLLFMQGQYYYNHKAGDLWEEDVEKGMASFDKYASAISYEFRLKRDAWELLYGFAKINAPKAGGNGSFSYGFGNAKGYLKLPTSGNYHGFRRDGEQAMVVAAKYDFRHFGLKDLNFTYGYHWGKAPTISKASDELVFGREHEHAITVGYEPRSGAMKGFVFNLKQAFHRPDAALGNVEATDPSDKGDRTATKFIVSYMFTL